MSQQAVSVDIIPNSAGDLRILLLTKILSRTTYAMHILYSGQYRAEKIEFTKVTFFQFSSFCNKLKVFVRNISKWRFPHALPRMRIPRRRHGGRGLAQRIRVPVPRVPGRVQLQEGGEADRPGGPTADPPRLGRDGGLSHYLLS